MPIRGVVTTGHVLRNARLIVREFGPAAFLRCCLAIVSRRRTTFLACVTPPVPLVSGNRIGVCRTSAPSHGAAVMNGTLTATP